MRAPVRETQKNHVIHVFVSTKRQKFNSDDRFRRSRSGRSQNEVKGQKGQISSFIYIWIGLDK